MNVRMFNLFTIGVASILLAAPSLLAQQPSPKQSAPVSPAPKQEQKKEQQKDQQKEPKKDQQAVLKLPHLHIVEIYNGDLRTVIYTAKDATPEQRKVLANLSRQESENALRLYEVAMKSRHLQDQEALNDAKRDAMLAYYQHATHYALGFRPISQLSPYYVGYPGPINPIAMGFGGNRFGGRFGGYGGFGGFGLSPYYFGIDGGMMPHPLQNSRGSGVYLSR